MENSYLDSINKTSLTFEQQNAFVRMKLSKVKYPEAEKICRLLQQNGFPKIVFNSDNSSIDFYYNPLNVYHALSIYENSSKEFLYNHAGEEILTEKVQAVTELGKYILGPTSTPILL